MRDRALVVSISKYQVFKVLVTLPDQSQAVSASRRPRLQVSACRAIVLSVGLFLATSYNYLSSSNSYLSHP
ncbi:D-arabinitol 2-dehydrogenase [Fusarium oxysporum f. sp. albedinis]|nr:D-arabinitol 2-dehydrogenase [Fusarium oxysporum f. sp. albedinis]